MRAAVAGVTAELEAAATDIWEDLSTEAFVPPEEYQFVRLDADLDDLRDVLRQVAREAPRCAVAAKQLQTLRRMLRRILAALDEDVTAAVAALERMAEEPPF